MAVKAACAACPSSAFFSAAVRAVRKDAISFCKSFGVVRLCSPREWPIQECCCVYFWPISVVFQPQTSLLYRRSRHIATAEGSWGLRGFRLCREGALFQLLLRGGQRRPQGRGLLQRPVLHTSGLQGPAPWPPALPCTSRLGLGDLLRLCFEARRQSFFHLLCQLIQGVLRACDLLRRGFRRRTLRPEPLNPWALDVSPPSFARFLAESERSFAAFRQIPCSPCEGLPKPRPGPTAGPTGAPAPQGTLWLSYGGS